MGMGYSEGHYGFLLFKAIAFIVASFVFSYIFWTTKKWVERADRGKE